MIASSGLADLKPTSPTGDGNDEFVGNWKNNIHFNKFKTNIPDRGRKQGHTRIVRHNVAGEFKTNIPDRGRKPMSANMARTLWDIFKTNIPDRGRKPSWFSLLIQSQEHSFKTNIPDRGRKLHRHAYNT